MIESQLEYELLSITIEQPYELPDDDDVLRVCEDDPDETGKAEIEYDADGVPMGNSREEIKIRQKIIYDFYEQWKHEHPQKSVFNKNLNADILIRNESVIEAAAHASKRYKSTLAVLKLDEVLSNATKIAADNPKPGNKNQSKLSQMIIMSCYFQDIGTIKLTVGVRRSTQDKIQYGITAIENGEKIRIGAASNVNKKKKAPHKK